MLIHQALWHSLALPCKFESTIRLGELTVTARDTRDSEHPTTYIKSNAIDFAREMLYRHAIVLRGVARDIKINSRSFILKRPDSSHLVIWSSQTEFLNTSPSTLNDAEVFVRGRTMNGRLLAESIASSE